MNMKITEMSITPVEGNPKRLANVRVTINGEYCLRNLRIMPPKSGESKPVLGMALEKIEKTQRFVEVFHPITADAREALEDVIFGAYEAMAGSMERKDFEFGMDKPSEITDIEIVMNPKSDSPVKAFASVVLDDAVKLKSVLVLESKDTGDLYIATPRRRAQEDSDQKPKHIWFPISAEAREKLQTAVLAKYAEVVAE